MPTGVRRRRDVLQPMRSGAMRGGPVLHGVWRTCFGSGADGASGGANDDGGWGGQPGTQAWGVAGGLVDGERSAAAAGDFVVFAAGAVVFAEFFGPPHLGRLGFGVGVDVDRDGTRCVRRSASDSGVGFVRAHAVGATAGIGDRVFGTAAISAGNSTGNLHPVGAAAGDERARI